MGVKLPKSFAQHVLDAAMRDAIFVARLQGWCEGAKVMAPMRLSLAGELVLEPQ